MTPSHPAVVASLRGKLLREGHTDTQFCFLGWTLHRLVNFDSVTHLLPQLQCGIVHVQEPQLLRALSSQYVHADGIGQAALIRLYQVVGHIACRRILWL